MDYIAPPLIRDLKRTFPVISIIVMSPDHGGFYTFGIYGAIAKDWSFFNSLLLDANCGSAYRGLKQFSLFCVNYRLLSEYACMAVQAMQLKPFWHLCSSLQHRNWNTAI